MKINPLCLSETCFSHSNIAQYVNIVLFIGPSEPPFGKAFTLAPGILGRLEALTIVQ